MHKFMSRVSLLITVTGCLLLLLQVAAYAETVSEEARRHMARGEAAMEMAKSPDEYDAAIKEFKDAARLAPGWPEPYRNLALLQEKMGKLKEAVSSLKEYLRLAPSAPDASKVRDHIYKLEYKVEQTLTIPEIIDVLVSLSDKQKWDVTGDCDTYTTFFSRDKGQWALGRKDILSRTSNEVYARVAGGYSPTTDVAYEVNGPILKHIFSADKYPSGQCAVPSDCCDDECMTCELREAEVVSRTLVKITQKVMKNVPRGRPEDGEVKEVLSCTYKAKAGAINASVKPPATDVNARDKEGNTPLHYAVLEGKKEMVELLIANGADVNAKDKSGATSLLHAVYNNKKEMVELLIAKDADINMKNNDGDTPLHYAAYYNRTEIADLLIAKGANINARNYTSRTPLECATSRNNNEMIDLLNNYGADILTDERAKLFISKSADINIKWNEHGHTLLHIAAFLGKEKLAELLIAKGADIKAKDNRGDTPLHKAAFESKKEIAELLIAKGADINAKDSYGETPLHDAVSKSNKEMAELLIAKGADIKAKDNRGDTPLHKAAFESKKEIAELLIAKGADINANSNGGETPLRIAMRLGNSNIVELLKKHGAKDEDSVKSEAVSSSKKEKDKRLIAKDVNINAKDENGDTPLHNAVSLGKKEMVEESIAKGANINTKDAYGYTPLHRAVEWDRKEIAGLLITKGADVSPKNKYGNTPLHTAAAHNQYDMVEFLIAKGANINAKNKNGHTPLKCAILWEQKEMIKLLKKHGAKE